MQRHTIRKPIEFSGYPVLPGRKVSMTILPANAGHGIRIKSKGKTSEPISARNITNASKGKNSIFGWSTVGVRVGNKIVPVMEHTVGAMVGAGITDALIDLKHHSSPPALEDTARIVFEAVTKERVALQGKSAPPSAFKLNNLALADERASLSPSAAARELEKRGIPQNIFPTEGQRVIMLAPTKAGLPDRIFLKSASGNGSTIAAFIEYPGVKAVKPQWFKIPLTEEGFRQVMSARGLGFYPPVIKGIFKALAGKKFFGIQIHGITQQTRLMVDKKMDTFDNPTGFQPRNKAEVAQHKIIDFMINTIDGIEGIDILLYRTGHRTEIEMMQRAIREGILH